LLQAKNIHKTYLNGKRELEVLSGIEVVVEKGKFVAIVGPSGAGKSTLLHILGGLDKPTRGKVTIDGNEIYSLPDAALSRLRNARIGFVFQFYHLLPEFTVLENVMMPALISGQKKDAPARQRAHDLLEKTGLSRRTDHFPGQLSGGEKQRVAIVRGLINQPDLFLCDEPTGNLDSKTGFEIMDLIKDISRETKMTVLLVTHNTELAKSADVTFVLRDGRLA
jgi:lipoprotein-releasing system ATP-binding protein